ncbi:MAG: hypothetical protein KAX38_01885 [Candidatus Krumholzibacteria bacterium]|nr:hypothetical protein [Candidatus Krumholzibacteria bacterium]
MKRLMVIFITICLMSGCQTVLKINNKSDPESFGLIPLDAGDRYFFREIRVEVPGEIRDDDFKLTRVDIHADVYADTIYSVGEVRFDIELYMGLESGEDDLDDPSKNELLASAVINEQGEHRSIEVGNSNLARRAMHREVFFYKTVIRTASPTYALMRVDNVYLDIWLERQTKGLFPFFYLF